MKILILSQNTIASEYFEIQERAKTTWQKTDKVRILNYTGGGGELTLRGNLLTLPVGDQVCNYPFGQYDSRGKKFMDAVKFCYNNFEFDYLYRISCTSYIDVERLIAYCEWLDSERVYMGCLNKNHENYIEFVSGFHAIFSRDVVERFITLEDKYLSYKLPEDLATGLLLFNGGYCDFWKQDHKNPTYEMVSSGNLNRSKNHTVFNYKIKPSDFKIMNDLHTIVKLRNEQG